MSWVPWYRGMEYRSLRFCAKRKEGLLQREGQCNSPEIALHAKRKIIPTAAVLCDGSDVQLTAADVPVDYNGSDF